MLEIHAKAVFLFERFFNRCEKAFITLRSLAASTAYQVMVVPFLSMVIDTMATQFTFENATCSF